ncbi:MAG: hypothetical protein MJ120_03105, partial [Clostridia bacterium]|nr:hypothetical protein [Clostridia bacterium]
MSELTYEKDGTLSLETFEWDSPWWEHTEKKDAPRVLYIGDSISHGTRPVLNRLADGKMLFDGFATSKALDNPYFKKSLELFMAQEENKTAILFNNGLHGWHLDDEQYKKYYGEMLAFLKKQGVPVFVVLTTNLPLDAEQNQRVIARNAIAEEVAKVYECETVDLYSTSLDCRELYLGDGV